MLVVKAGGVGSWADRCGESQVMAVPLVGGNPHPQEEDPLSGG